MSRSDKTLNTEKPNSPCVRYFEWAGSKGQLKWYNKETKENIFVTLPFRFLVLDQLNTVTGYDKKTDSSFWSPEVRRNSDPLYVHKRGVALPLCIGPWRDIKEIAPRGAKFTKSVYIAFKDDDGELKIGNLRLSGAAISGLSDDAIAKNIQDFKKDKGNTELFEDDFLKRVGWFKFVNTCPGDIEDIAVEIDSVIADVNGTVEFMRPVFKRVPLVSEETANAALELDRILQKYLTEYFAYCAKMNAEYNGQSGYEGKGSTFNTEYDAQRPLSKPDADEFPTHTGADHDEPPFHYGDPPDADDSIPF